MNDYKNKPGSTNLFVNTNKKEDKHPDYRGQQLEITEAGVYDVAMWKKKTKDGKEYFGISVSKPFVKREAQQQQQPQQQPLATHYYDADGEVLPF